MIKVTGSHIYEYEYLEKYSALLVGYTDGSLYAWADILPSKWEQLQAAKSKGGYMAELQKEVGKGILLKRRSSPVEKMHG